MLCLCVTLSVPWFQRLFARRKKQEARTESLWSMASNIRQNSTLLFYVEHFSFLWTFCILYSSLYSTCKFVFVQVCILHSYVFILFDCSHFTFKFAFCSLNFLHSTFKFVFYIHKFSFYSTVRILHSSLHFVH